MNLLIIVVFGVDFRPLFYNLEIQIQVAWHDDICISFYLKKFFITLLILNIIKFYFV